MQVFSHLHAVIFMSSAKMGYHSLHAGLDVQNWSFLHAGSNAQPNYAKSHASREYVRFLVVSSCMQGFISYFCNRHQNACLSPDAFFMLSLGHIVLWYGAGLIMARCVLWGILSYRSWCIFGILSLGILSLWHWLFGGSLFLGLLYAYYLRAWCFWV